jgi:Sulfotransferase domain
MDELFLPRMPTCLPLPRSYRQTVWRRFVSDPVLRFLSHIDPPSYYGHILHRLLPLYFNNTETGILEPVHGKYIFMQHNSNIRNLVPKDKLLEWKVGENDWAKLCAFLGKDIPVEKFPESNERGRYWPDCRRRDWGRIWIMGAKALVWMMPLGVGVFALKAMYPAAV